MAEIVVHKLYEEKERQNIGRSLGQVMEHCESILDKLDDPNYGEPISVLEAEIERMIAEWK